jgi:hypothetical protein
VCLALIAERDLSGQLVSRMSAAAWGAIVASVRTLLESNQLTYVLGSEHPLNGGLLNFVWRIRVRRQLPATTSSAASEDAGVSTAIIKYSPPYIATQPSVSFDPVRLSFEVAALASTHIRCEGAQDARTHDDVLTPASPSSLKPAAILTPGVIAFDSSVPVAVLQDLGRLESVDEVIKSTSISEATDAGTAAHALGVALGNFLAGLHTRTFLAARSDPSTLDPGQFINQGVQDMRLKFQYETMAAVCKDVEAELGCVSSERELASVGATAIAMGTTFAKQRGMCLIMGDFWPRSILTVPSLQSAGVIDWELCHWGNPAQDIGHFVAHCLMQIIASPEGREQRTAFLWTTLLQGFLDAYKVAVHADGLEVFRSEWLERTCNSFIFVHAGCEILARLGRFREGYVFEHADRSVLLDALQLAKLLLLSSHEPFDLDASGKSASLFLMLQSHLPIVPE